MIQETTKIGKRGSLIIPSSLRQQFDLKDGSMVIAEEHENGILIRPAYVMPLDRYSNQQKAEYLLNNSTDLEDYKHAVEDVRAMGIDPKTIPHKKPKR